MSARDQHPSLSATDVLRPWLIHWMYRPGGPVYRLAEARFYAAAAAPEPTNTPPVSPRASNPLVFKKLFF